MAIGQVGGNTPYIPSSYNTNPSSEVNANTPPEQLLSKAMQGDQKAIEALAQKLGIDPEQLKQLIQALTGGQPQQPGGSEGTGKPGGSEGTGKPGGADGTKPGGDIGQLLQALMQAVQELKNGKTPGQTQGQNGHSTNDTYEAAPEKGPVNLQGGDPGTPTVPAPIEPPSI